MNKWVCLAKNATVLYVMTLADDAMVPDESAGKCIRVDANTSDEAYMAMYYDFEASEFVPLPPKPSESYVFDYGTKSWLVDTQKAIREAGHKRAKLLAASDYTQLPDVPLDNKELWAVYRQALRDITEQPGYPIQINWPTAPGQE